MNKTTLQITVSKMPNAEQYGDWHDKPLKWVVSGPSNEVQKFSTKKDALNFASRRRNSGNQVEAFNKLARLG